jgi:hypothetical protein
MNSSSNAFSLLRSHMLRRWVALAFLLGLAAAYASPVIQPHSMELVCSTHGIVKLLSPATDSNEPNSDVVHCSLCVPLAAPPPASIQPTFQSALAYATQRSFKSALAALTRPPLPARGPPDFS